MTTRTEYAHGEFSWVELATTDPAAAKRFYGRLFGWQASDMPAGPGMTYTMVQLKNQYVAGMYALDKDRQAQGVPPHWLTYFAVTDCDAAAKQVGELGGTVVRVPDDIPNVGRFAVCRDGQGAVFALFTPKNP